MYESMMAPMELFWTLKELLWEPRELFCRFSIRDPKVEGSFPRATSDAKPAAWSAGRLAISEAMASGDHR